jgi:DNA replication protein DnaC
VSATASELAFLSRALKAPRIREVAERLATRARDEGWDYPAYLAAVLTEEVTSRDSHDAAARVKAARFPGLKTLDDFDFTIQTSVNRQLIAHLAQLDFLAEASNVVFLGPPGTGKTHLSIALGVAAARRGQRVAFATAHQWVNRLGAAKRAGRLDDELERLGRIPLLVVDEVGYIPFDPEAAALFFALISSRYERRSLIVELQQDVQCLGRDLRRPGRGGRHGRPPGPSRRGHRPQGRLLSAQRQAGGGAERRQTPLTCSDFSRRPLLRIRPALTPRGAGVRASNWHCSPTIIARWMGPFVPEGRRPRATSPGDLVRGSVPQLGRRRRLSPRRCSVPAR